MPPVQRFMPAFRTLGASAFMLALVAFVPVQIAYAVFDPPPPPPPPVVTEHEVKIGDKVIKYKASTGKLPLKDDAGKIKAEVFFVAYERTDADVGEPRPLTFAFNGGPGSSSVWLHMGALGPRRVDFGVDGEQIGPPARLVDNANSWLDMTDLVFIDPVSTGFSRATEGEDPHQFHGLSEDIRAVGEFIRLYTTRNNRWLSPKFLAGESYGTTRAAGLASYLQDEVGMGINGIVLVSPVLLFQTISFDTGNDMPYWLFMPSYAATAWHHKKLGTDLQQDLEKTLAAAQKWANSDYVQALAKGDALTDAEKGAVAEQLARFTGVSKEFALRCDLRIKMDQFAKELLRDQARTVGRFDSRYKGIDRNEAGANPDYDPSYSVVKAPFAGAFNAYVRGELKFETDLNYEILTGRVHPWNLGATNRYAETADSLRQAMTANPRLQLLVCTGYYDLATPFSAADYTVEHLGLDKTLKGNVSITRYKAGHMMYLRQDDREKLKKDAAEFYGRAVKQGN